MADVDWDAIAKRELGTFTTSKLPPTLELPALPIAATTFIQKSNDPDVPLEELARIIETDSGLTAELLKYVNSSFMGLRNRAKTVAHTIALLGRTQAKTHVVTTATKAAVRARKSRLINQSTFWASSLQKALFAREVARLLKADADLAFAGALLQDFLLPVISNEKLDTYLDFLSTRDGQPNCLVEYEQTQFRWDHTLAAAGLAMRWNLPADLVCCILCHHHGLRILGDKQLGRTAVAAVAVSALLPDELRQQKLGLEQLAKLSQKWNAFDLARIAETVDREQEAVGLGVKNAFPLSRLCRPILAAI